VSKPNALVIVESPAKARTLTNILGSAYEIASSMGHIIDLPRRKMGIDIAHAFAPTYEVIPGRKKLAQALRSQAKGKAKIFLATDPDREGEAISWHIAQLLNDGKSEQTLHRIVFHEITKRAIEHAMKHPGDIDVKKVNAQQARRILDRLVGYTLSPLLWRKVGRGLSAGRVQSVAVKLIVDRERAIEAFTPQEYWTITALVSHGDEAPRFTAQLDTVNGQKAEVATQAQADEIVAALTHQPLAVSQVEKKERKQHPRAPFTTSTLQQTAYNKLHFSSARTMRLAQDLYEGLEIGEADATGLITYMRTDSVRIASEALSAVREHIQSAYGQEYLPAQPNAYKSKRTAQEAHEAIRPTDVRRTPDQLKPHLSEAQLALYQLIWSRFVASQMAEAIFEATTVTIAAGPYTLKATGRVPLFLGFLKAYGVTAEEDEDTPEEERLFPALTDGDPLTLHECTPEQHFTKPPPRFTDGSLVKTLEDNGIGRPSTYAPIIQTIVERDYVRRQGGSFIPTPMGRVVTDLLTQHFPQIMDEAFTAAMETQLDEIEEGHVEWVEVLRQFHEPFQRTLETAQVQMRNVKREVIPVGETCPQCGRPMVIKWSRYGQFIGCSGFPQCKQAKPLSTGVKCQQPGCEGELVERRGRRGRAFYGCSKYPTCRAVMRRLPTEHEEESQARELSD